MAQALSRFMTKVDKADNGCWNWLASLTLPNKVSSGGYGRFTLNYKTVLAHRYSYETYKGEISEGMQIDHLCSNRRCVNTEHLEAVSGFENLKRSGVWKVNTNKTHCPQGHEYTVSNTKIGRSRTQRPTRQCRECANNRLRETYKAHPEKWARTK